MNDKTAGSREEADSDQRFQSWVDRIRLIQRETAHLFSNRKMFRLVVRMFETNPELRRAGDHVWWWLAGLYGRDAVMGIRRELDGQAGVLNLYHLLHEMEKHAHVLTRGRYEAHTRILASLAPEYIDAQFQQFGGPPGPGTSKDHVSPQAIARDRDSLRRDTAAAFDYAQRLVAHRTPIGELQLTLREVDGALQAVYECLRKYYGFLTASMLAAATPVPQYDLVAPFRIPWVTAEFRIPDDD